MAGDDVELLQQFVDGKREAFEALYRRGSGTCCNLRIRDRLRISHAAFGALIPLILVPMVRLRLPTLIGTEDMLFVLPLGMAAYYLVWKFVVGFLNHEMGIA